MYLHISSETLAFVKRTLKIQMTHTYKGFVLNRSLQENLDFILRKEVDIYDAAKHTASKSR